MRLRRKILSMLLTTTLLIGLCQPVAAQSVSPTFGGSCWAGTSSNQMTAWSQLTLSGSLPNSVLWARIIFETWPLGSCPLGSGPSGGTCTDKAYPDGDKTARASGHTSGVPEGFHEFTARAALEEGGDPPFWLPDQPFTRLCPAPPPPEAGCKTNCSPIIVPIRNGNHVKLSSVETGVFFDIDGDGDLELTAWPEEPDDVAFLAIDRNGDGAITGGNELFGSATVPGAGSGFISLGLLLEEERDTRYGHLLAGRDPGFDSLLLWFDRNRDGVSQPNELEKATDYLVAISLHAVAYIGKRDQHGNLFRVQGWMKLASKPEEKRPVYDIFFRVQQ